MLDCGLGDPGSRRDQPLKAQCIGGGNLQTGLTANSVPSPQCDVLRAEGEALTLGPKRSAHRRPLAEEALLGVCLHGQRRAEHGSHSWASRMSRPFLRFCPTTNPMVS